MIQLRKGEWGYFHRKKCFQLFMILLCILAIFAFCIVGYITTKTMKNLMTVLAVLFSLPLANFAVVLIAVFPYRAEDKEISEAIRAGVKNGVFLTELAVTSPSDPTLHAAYAYLHETQVWIYSPQASLNSKKAQQYLEGMLSANGYGSAKVSICQDLSEFQKQLTVLEAVPMEEKQKQTAEGMANVLKSISI